MDDCKGCIDCMSAASVTVDERARKATSTVLQRLAPEGTQRNLAQAWGVSESTVSRLKEQIEPVMRLVAQLGLKVVPAEMKCYSPRELDAMFVLAKANMNRAESVDDVLRWDE
jgi:hypothetical protein